MALESFRHRAGQAVVGGLCVAAALAILALLARSWDDTTGRLIVTSLGFSVFTAFGGAGAAAAARPGATGTVGIATVAASGLAFVLLLACVWPDWTGDATVARAFGCVAIGALVGSHASTVLRARRRRDTPLIEALGRASIGAAVLDGGGVALLIAGALDDPGPGAARFAGVVLVAFLLTSALPPILRRLAPPAAATSGLPAVPRSFPAEVLAAADRLDALATSTPQRHEIAQLRAAARGAMRT